MIQIMTHCLMKKVMTGMRVGVIQATKRLIIQEKRDSMAKVTSSFTFHEKPKRKRPGVNSKSRTSKLKSSKNYHKAYRGQGRI